MLKFGKKEIAKEKFYASKIPTEIWDANADNIVVSKLVKTKTNSKYLIGIKYNKAIRPLVLIMPTMSEYLRHLNLEKEIKIKAIN